MGLEEDLYNLFGRIDLKDTSAFNRLIIEMITEAERSILMAMRRQIDTKLASFTSTNSSMDPFSILGIGIAVTYGSLRDAGVV